MNIVCCGLVCETPVFAFRRNEKVFRVVKFKSTAACEAALRHTGGKTRPCSDMKAVEKCFCLLVLRI